ncbi:MAG: tRNA (uridine(34)/cytosine(34)/5-carboxymethylaminomethyluridine(34)-2'-O)-methyltransferase TrmL, partial [Mailhella sp.]|nr:tRNA (uridine(34)/cytosine(34)/5-carboxymethylaminomethyluridine(34)-2'-O)-methyltransferase TrmL [Mailhella sp.]
MHVVLFHPEIPPNTGNIARLCAATGTGLHLIGPLGFSLEDRYLKRAGLDYWPHVQMRVWPSLEAYLSGEGLGRRL